MDQKNLYFNKKKKKISVETLNNMRKVMPSFILFLKKKKIMIYFVLFWELDKIQKPSMRF